MKKAVIIISSVIMLKPVMAQEMTFYNQAQKSQVVLYEHGKFGGQSKAFGIGEYRFTTPADFNDIASSIKVPAGFVAVIYENANESGGYGNYVDLMEDCENLSTYDFNDKVSYLRVFNVSSRPGYVYVRNKRINNQFSAGHWEKEKSSGAKPDNSPPAVPSSLPESGLPAKATTLTVNGAVTTITSLGAQTSDGKILWDKATNDQMGIIANDYRGIEKIGTAAFEREFTGNNGAKVADALGLSHINFWFPQKNTDPRDHLSLYKRTLHGKVIKSAQEEITDWLPDYDVHVNIEPSPKFEYLLKNAKPPNLSHLTEVGQKIKGEKVGCPTKFTTIEAEISPDYWPKGNRLYGRSIFADMCLKRVGYEMCVYGAWIYDAGHCDQPEIHPAEQFWWNENVPGGKKYSMNVFCDASRRYFWRDQMDNGEKLKPWGAPPVKGLFAIAFEIDLGTDVASMSTKKFETSYIDHYNLIEYPNADQTYTLVYQNKTLVSFVPHNNAFKVSYENVGKVTGTNKIRGFLVIETSVGKLTQTATSLNIGSTNIQFSPGTSPESVPEKYERNIFKKEEGYYLFSIMETSVSSKIPVNINTEKKN